MDVLNVSEIQSVSGGWAMLVVITLPAASQTGVGGSFGGGKSNGNGAGSSY